MQYIHRLPLYLAWYWRLYTLLSLAGFALIANYLTDGSVKLIWLVKFPQAALILLLFWFHLQYNLRITGVAVIFLFGGILAMLVGTLRGTVLSEGLMTHAFMTMMPILAASFGAYVAELPTSIGRPIFQHALRQIFWLSIITILLYVYFHYITGQIAYYGFDSYLPVVAAWFIAERRYLLVFLSFALVLLSGKRAPLLTMLITLSVTSLQSSSHSHWRRIFYILGMIFVSAATILLALQLDLLYRFDAVFAVDISDSDSLFLATSGRSSEFMGLLAARRDNPILWWTGGGLGDGYTPIESIFSEDSPEKKYYLHLALLTYILVFGVPFTLILVVYVGLTVWRVREQMDHFYVIGAIMMFTWSIFGAGMLVEPMFWFFLGACTSLRRHNG